MEENISVKQPLFSNVALRQLIIPLIIEMFLLMSVGMADTVMVTSAGEAAVSAVSLVDSINLLLIQIFAALSTGGAVVVSQYLGRQDPEKAQSAARHLIYTVLGVSTVLMLAALIFRQHILSFIFGRIEPDVMANALLYFISTALAYPFISIYNAGAALFRSMGNSRVSMFCSLLVNIINISVNAILIFGFQMGVLGAGIGTLVSRIAAAAIILFLLVRHDHPLRMGGFFRLEFHWRMVKRILAIGIPTGLENGLFQAGKLVVLGLITSFGTAAVAANAIAVSVSGVVIVPGQAIGLAMVTVVGQCMGAREIDQAVTYTRKLLLITYLCVGSMCILSFVGASGLVGLFHLSPEATGMAVQVLRWSAVFTLLIWPLSFTLPNALRSSGDALFTMTVSLFSMAAFRIVFSHVLASSWGFGLGLLGVWMGMFIDWAARACAFVFRFLRGRWKTKRVI